MAAHAVERLVRDEYQMTTVGVIRQRFARRVEFGISALPPT
jgi:hypothetical protein